MVVKTTTRSQTFKADLEWLRRSQAWTGNRILLQGSAVKERFFSLIFKERKILIPYVYEKEYLLSCKVR